jgi:hypothetical protein
MDVDAKKLNEIVHTFPTMIAALQKVELNLMELRQALIKAIGEDDE